jgi:hypothetical protein
MTTATCFPEVERAPVELAPPVETPKEAFVRRVKEAYERTGAVPVVFDFLYIYPDCSTVGACAIGALVSEHHPRLLKGGKANDDWIMAEGARLLGESMAFVWGVVNGFDGCESSDGSMHGDLGVEWTRRKAADYRRGHSFGVAARSEFRPD